MFYKEITTISPKELQSEPDLKSMDIPKLHMHILIIQGVAIFERNFYFRKSDFI